MTTLELFRKQLEQEGEITRRFIHRIPYDRLDFKPHPKSMSLGYLIAHIGEIPGWFEGVLKNDELDLQKDPFAPVIIGSEKEMTDHFESNLSAGIQALDNRYMDKLDKMWTLRDGDQIYLTVSKLDCLMQCLGQIPHHRAQLGVYLRLMDIPVPGSYGPSADELEMMEAVGN